MKVKVKFWEREDSSGAGFDISSDVKGGSYSLRWCDDSPEDQRYGRNLEDHSGIIELIKAAYEAGKNGDPLELVEEEDND